MEPTTAEVETTHACPTCGKDTPDLRMELLGVETCKDCTVQPTLPSLEDALDLRAGECDVEVDSDGE